MITLGVVLGIICMLAADTDVSGKAWSIVCEATHNVCGTWRTCKRAMARVRASLEHHLWLAEVDCLEAWRFVLEAITAAERAYQNVQGVRLMAALL